MSNNRKRKKGKLMDWGMTIVLAAFTIGIVVMVVAIVRTNMAKKAEEEAASATAVPTVTSEPTATPVKNEAEITRYSCVIAEKGEDENSGSAFCLELNERTGTYEELLNAGSSSSVLNHGTFERQSDGIKTVNKDKEENMLYYYGKYLVSEKGLYEGTVPEKKMFSRTFSNEVDGESKVELVFKKDGTFTQNIVRYSAALDGSDTEDAMSGTYERDGKFIKRTKDDGTEAMSLIVYKGQLCTSYYKLEKEAEQE